MPAPPVSGPSGNAWGVPLTAPAMVTHQGRLIAFARAEKAPTATLYFQVLDPQATMNAADESAWNGWYRFEFPEAPPPAPGNVRWREQQPPPQLRLAGMDLLTVTETATKVQPADASFQVFSDDRYLYVFRPSAGGTLYLTRLMLLSSSQDDKTYYALEPAWEVRYQRSGLRDVPADDTDTQSFVDLTGAPFLEPTVELSQLKGITDGAYAVARVPTANPSKVVWYVACAQANGVQLYSFTQDADAVTNFTESPHVYTLIAPSLSSGGALPPIAKLAPALLFYAEQDGETGAAGEKVEIQRAGRLMLAIPVAGAGLEAATVIYDFGLTAQGTIPDLPSDKQAVVLVDGTITGGRFVPDESSPSFPTPAQAEATVQVIDGLTVGSMVLGQVQPHADPGLRMGEDGLVHLYHGGPLATEMEAIVGWYALIPGMPMAMVAQFDPRVSRVVLAVPWRHAVPSEQPAGNVYFTARQSGPAMTGAQISVADTTFGSGPAAQAQPDLCTVIATYPAETGLPSETWTGVPRAVDALAQVLDGDASDDSADPEVAAGNRPFFDFGGTLALARVPVLAPNSPPPPSGGPYPSALTFVSTRTTIALTSVAVSTASTDKQVVLTFNDAAGHALQQTWPALPATVDAYPDIFGGSAATYSYTPGAGTTPLFALATDAAGVPAPVVLYPNGSGPNVAAMTIGVSAGASGTLDVRFDNGAPFVVTGVPAAAERFAAALIADSRVAALGLEIDVSGVAGAVVPTASPVGAVDLRGAAALFDLVAPRQAITGFAALDGSRTAGLTGHAITPPADYDRTRMVGFVVTHDNPEPGSAAYITNDPSVAGVNRELAGEPVAQAGAWIRQTPHGACAFTGTDSMSVPVAANGAIVPSSVNLRPEWDWTLEAWVLPAGSAEQRLVTFHDGVTPVPSYAPELDYRIGLTGAQVLEFGSYAKQSGTPDSSFFLTGTVADVPFLQGGEFTWEVWIQPTATPAPAPGTLGGVIEVGVPTLPNPALSIGLTQDRHVIVRVTTEDGQTKDLTSQGIVADDDGDGEPEWTHLALVATQDPVGGKWKLLLYIDAVLDSTFTDVYIPVDDPRARLIIGRNTLDDASMFGQLTQLRFWSAARTLADIRRTAFLTVSGSEAGLLGCWPMSGIAGQAGSQYLKNIAVTTGDDWNADLQQFKQPVSAADDDVFLSVVASVAGLPAVEAQTLLVNGRWNHFAVVFNAGGALDLNPASRFDAGQYDWMRVEPDGLTPGSEFAIDAWLTIPKRPAATGTIAAQWAWDEAPEDQSYELLVEPSGTVVLAVKVDDDQGATHDFSVSTSGIDVADGSPHHVAAVVETIDATDGGDAACDLTLYVDGVQRGNKNETVKGRSARLQTSQAEFTVGRTHVAPPGAEPQAVESLGLFRGTLGRLRFWQTKPTPAQLFPETEDAVPAFGPPPGLAAEWDFDEQTGVVAADSIGGNDGTLTSSSAWSSLRATSTLTFYANGGVVAGVGPYDGTLAPAASSQFNLGAPAESGVTGFNGKIAQVSLWSAARTLETIQDQQFVPLDGDEEDLLACWDFSGTIAGTDITGGGNNASPPIAPARVGPSTVPITDEGAAVINVYGGAITEVSECTPGRMAVGSYVDVQQSGTARPLAVLKRQYVLDPMSSFGRGIQVGLLDLVYIGQVQTRPTLIGYIEGAPPVPSENLTRPFYLSGLGYTAYFNTASVALVQQGSEKVTYSATATNLGTLSISAALGIMGMQKHENLELQFISEEELVLKGLAQLVFKSETTWGTEEGSQLNASWTAEQRDASAVIGEWEPFEADGQNYLDPGVGRRFIPANVGVGLVESLTADLYAVVFHRTGAAIGTIVIPDLGIPPDRNVLVFPLRGRYTKNGTLDGKVGLANDPDYRDADSRRGSYFRPAEAYALAESIEQDAERMRAYAEQFDWEGRGKTGKDDISDVRKEHLPVDFDATPRDTGQAAVLRAGIANRYVWTAGGGLHQERQGYASSASRSHVGLTKRTLGGGLHAEAQFFLFSLGWQGSLDLMASHTLDVHVGVTDETSESVALEVAVQGEPYLHRWDPNAPNEYAGTGAFDAEVAPGKVTAYRFFSFFLPPSSRNAAQFGTIVDPIWKQLSNDPAARALRELDASNPVWRVMHRVTYVERVPPPIASRPLYTVGSDVREPVNVAGNVELLRLVAAALGNTTVPTPVNVGAAVATVMNPPPTGPGTYPESVLERLVPWWRTFLDAARGTPANAAAAELLARLVTEVVDYTVAGYRTGVLPGALTDGNGAVETRSAQLGTQAFAPAGLSARLY